MAKLEIPDKVTDTLTIAGAVGVGVATFMNEATRKWWEGRAGYEKWSTGHLVDTLLQVGVPRSVIAQIFEGEPGGRVAKFEFNPTGFLNKTFAVALGAKIALALGKAWIPGRAFEVADTLTTAALLGGGIGGMFDPHGAPGPAPAHGRLAANWWTT